MKENPPTEQNDTSNNNVTNEDLVDVTENNHDEIYEEQCIDGICYQIDSLAFSDSSDYDMGELVMTLEELVREVPELEEYTRYMPEELWQRCSIRVYPPGTIIHQKDYKLEYFGHIAKGEHRVINEFQNGNVYMIEKNEPIDFVGEVTILAGMEKTSVTIETLTETTVAFFSRKDFEDWISKDIHFLRLVAHKVAYKLYRSSYNRGARLFYPPHFILLDYILKAAAAMDIEKKHEIILPKTRQALYEECGITVKTINRTVKKLKDEGLISLRKGKISMTSEQYRKAQKVIHHYVNYEDWSS